ncbi:DUF7711 family protein [Vallicoccus soli]|uniref:DUF7711 domain-containing protein n=1 Tax=Vallicoccus soli TaxID=2339232 RepID=A0A3A3YZV6_9ACTN|nr:hypothetical protein [Vallicoccus soli]RJK96413.1 hypothetical protein D5H78_09295 [Vallicoccus soli]
MKPSRAAHHVRTLAEACAAMAGRPATIFPLRVQELWVWGGALEPGRDVERVGVALAVDLPAADVPWLGEPKGAQHWADATRMSRTPFTPRWRSVHAPVWNHRVERPLLVWDAPGGPREDALGALAEGAAQALRAPAPPPDALRDRLERERAVSLAELAAATAAYEERRWAPGKLEPHADRLARASAGYLDVLDGLAGLALA